ncbi:MAG: hypothetical protein JKX82_04925 [Oleispira sp.]|nr:hypothetical protein [Oleispira sp.]
MKKKETNILIVGHGLHGKDTLGDMLSVELGYKFRGSSKVAAISVIFPLLSEFYKDPEAAFNDRRNHRELWRALISDFNRTDATRLCKLVCAGGFGYTGLRDLREVITAVKQGVFTHVIWIRRPELEENDPTMMFDLGILEGLIKKCYPFGLAYIENHTEEVLLDVVQNELKEFLAKNPVDRVTYLRVTRNKLISEY